jgi:uncharacterized protein YbjQ (UPF0145 family)
MMKLRYLLALSALAATTNVAMARTIVATYPLKPVLDALPSDNQVAFYFGDAAHAPVTTSRGRGTESIRIARKLESETVSCNEALRQALAALRADALNHGANAVVNIETSFHSTHTASSSDFTCATSGSAAALKVRGELVTLGTK